MDKFLETYSPPKLNQEEIDNLNKPLTRSKLETVILITHYKQKSNTRWLHWGILPNIQRRTYTDSSQTLPKNWRGGNSSKFFPWSHHYPDTKTRKRHYQKLQANIFEEYRWKHSQQNTSKTNTTH